MKKAWPFLLILLALNSKIFAQAPVAATTTDALMLTVEGEVQVYPIGGAAWGVAKTNQVLHLGDRIRTSERSRATIRLSDLTVLRLNELTTLQLRPSEASAARQLLDVKSGSAFFLGREKPPKQEFRTPLTSGAIRGTEFNLAVAEDGRTVVTLIDGELALSNQLGNVEMTSGYQGIVETGKAPIKTPMLEAMNIIQWCLYYPGVLDADELELSVEEQGALAGSLTAYRGGDLLASVAQYPPHRTPVSPNEKVYRAATLLSVGQVEQAESLLNDVQKNGAQSSRPNRLAGALLEVIAVVKNQPVTRLANSNLATEWLAESYYLQSHSQLKEALQSAQAAVSKSPNFGFGWARVADLDLCMGYLPQSLASVEKSLQLSPRNAQAIAVKGFIELAQGQIDPASASFAQAIAVDGALGNGWLGSGLCKIRRGHAEAGLKDVQVAAVMEPQRAVLRSYLGKAFSNNGDNRRAKKELSLAEQMDPNDPTAWLYKALVNQQDNEINPAVRNLEESQNLNDNRSIFRSRLLLDEDQAVRSANLARIYQDTGYYNWNKDTAASDWGTRVASRAVEYDYANYSAHQFLADNYDALRDPNQINLRYETPWFDELIKANLLSPVAAGNLSEFSSQRQASELFEQNHFGVISDSEYLSRGDWLLRGSQYGTYDDFTYAIDTEYVSQDGWRVNDSSEQATTSAKVKFQLTPQDSLFVEGIYYTSTFGDTAQYYNEYGTVPGVKPVPSSQFSGNDKQQPDAIIGYHHEWGPGSHTLILGGYLNAQLQYDNPQAQGLFIVPGVLITNYNFPLNYDRQFQAYSAELQQIKQSEDQTFVGGLRYQGGWTTTSASEVNGNPSDIFNPKTWSQNYNNNFERYTAYGYETVKLFEPLQITGGVAYDYLGYPQNIYFAPINGAETSEHQWSPKAGFIWTVAPETFFRFAYTKSLGGLSFDNSLSLQPTEVAGFNQTFRSIIPESIGGLPGSKFTTYAVGLERSFKSNTYLSIEGQILDSDGTGNIGVINGARIFRGYTSTGPGTVQESLNYTEETLAASLTQLVGDDWALGGRYELSHADLSSQLVGYSPSQDQSATFQQLIMHINYVHPSGFFGQLQSIWTAQENYGYTPSLSGANFWQFNAYLGYRFFHRRAEARIGLLNITDQNYLLNPINLYYDLPRERTLALSFKFYF